MNDFRTGNEPGWHGTTILTVRKGGRVVIAGDGQVSFGNTVIKSKARKVRSVARGDVIGGFAGATADAFTLFERLEGKLEQYPGQLMRAAEHDVMGIGSGGMYALAAARALLDQPFDAETIARRAMEIAADICVFTNRNLILESLPSDR